MDCFPSTSTSTSNNSTAQYCIPNDEDCNSIKVQAASALSGHCFWDESIFDCFQDLSINSAHSSNYWMGGSSRQFQPQNNDNAVINTTTTRNQEHPSSSNIPMGALRSSNSSTTTIPQNAVAAIAIVSPMDVSILSHDLIDEEGNPEEDCGGSHAALHYQDVEDAGPPAPPIEFPTPSVHDGVLTQVRALDHRNRTIRSVKNVLMAASCIQSRARLIASSFYDPTYSNPMEQRAYLIKKKIAKSNHGTTYIGVVLKRRRAGWNANSNICDHSNNIDNNSENEKRQDDEFEPQVEWESTDEFVKILISPSALKNYYQQELHRRQHQQDDGNDNVVNAIAALQHIGDYHPHLEALLNVFQDEEYIYTVTKCQQTSIDLQAKILAGRQLGTYVPNEPQVRLIFTQLLRAIFHLQRKGVCHSQITLESVFVDALTHRNLVVTGFNRSMRIPYSDPANFGGIIGETEGSTRRLLEALPHNFANRPSSDLMYLSPEVIENDPAFDGFALDIWSAGCILFVLLVGMAPFKTANYWDAAYAEISKGNLKGLLQSLNIRLSDEAVGLLQNMFWRDPRDRLTLAQIMEHPWVQNKKFSDERNVQTAQTPSSGIGESIRRNISNGHLSAVETSSTTSSYATDDKSSRRKKSQHRRRHSNSSSGSKKSLKKAISGFFGSSSNKTNDSSSHSNLPKRRSMSRGLSGLFSSSSTKPMSRKNSNESSASNPSSTGNSGRRMSLGGLSAAASTVSAGCSPLTPRSDEEEGKEKESASSGALQLIEIPQL